MITKHSIAALSLIAAPVFAGTPAPLPPVPAQADSRWHFRVAPYLWAQGLEGTIGVRGLTGEMDIAFGDIFEDLEFSFMAAFEARKGRWSILTDINYTELSDSFSSRRGVVFSGGDVRMQQVLGNVTLNYLVTESERTNIAVYGGTRLNWLDLEISLEGELAEDTSRSGDEFWMDVIAGVRLQQNLGGTWFLRVGGDIGAGESDFTWQAMGLIGYRVNENFNLGLGYRGLGTDYENDGFTCDVTAHGPVVGAEWRW